MPKRQKSQQTLEQFVAEFVPLEKIEGLLILTDKLTKARFCECHIKASTLVPLGTTDVPLDPGEQGEYRANREFRLNHPAFRQMQKDAKKGRSFSNIVAEYTYEFDAEHPLKIVGGQHRYKAIQDALQEGVDEHHGVKVYFGLDKSQRLDVQLISNTTIAISKDLFDRMQETHEGPDLRNWCQQVDFLNEEEDFADQYRRGGRSQLGWRSRLSSIISWEQSYRPISSEQPRPFPYCASAGSLIQIGIN